LHIRAKSFDLPAFIVNFHQKQASMSSVKLGHEASGPVAVSNSWLPKLADLSLMFW
jgi:hypothetical protein